MACRQGTRSRGVTWPSGASLGTATHHNSHLQLAPQVGNLSSVVMLDPPRVGARRLRGRGAGALGAQGPVQQRRCVKHATPTAAHARGAGGSKRRCSCVGGGKTHLHLALQLVNLGLVLALCVGARRLQGRGAGALGAQGPPQQAVPPWQGPRWSVPQPRLLVRAVRRAGAQVQRR